MMRRLWSRVGVAPRIAMVIVLTFVGTQLFEKALRLLVPPPDFLFLDRDWLVDATAEAQRTAAAAGADRRNAALSSLKSAEWLDFSIEQDAPARPSGDLPDSVAALRAQIVDRLDLHSDHVVVRAGPFGSPLRAVKSGLVILPKLPALMTNMTSDAIQNDVLVMSELKIGIQLADRSRLAVTQRERDLTSARFWRNIALFIGGMLFVCGLSIWMARALLKPLTHLAAAAERLGREREPTPIGQMAIPEYAAIARAFNEMQSRLKRFVDERTNMLAAISHDLRTPLTRLRLFAEYVPDEDQRQQVLSNISEMETMIQSSLAFATEEARREPHGVVDIASLLISLCDNCTDMGADVGYHGPDHAPLACQPVAMRRALSNLIDNGHRYGGRVDITLRDETQAVVIAIADAGPGISPDQMEQAFAPFQRLDNSRNRATGGTGLGLTIARDVIRGHGGEITLSSARPAGLLVTVRLPKPTQALAGNRAATRPEPAVSNAAR